MTTQRATRRAGQETPAAGDAQGLLTIGEACQILHVHTNTLRRWGEMGLLRVCRLGPRGDRRYRREDIEALLLTRTD